MTVMGLPLSPGAGMKPVASPVAWIWIGLASLISIAVDEFGYKMRREAGRLSQRHAETEKIFSVSYVQQIKAPSEREIFAQGKRSVALIGPPWFKPIPSELNACAGSVAATGSFFTVPNGVP